MKKLIILLLVSLFIFINCNKENENEYETSKKINAVIYKISGEVFLNGEKAELGEKLSNIDTLETKNGYVIIEILNIGKISLKPNTKIRFASIIESDIEILQSSGKTFSKIDQKGTNFKIITPTTVASVRGTSFEVEIANKEKTKIRLLEGKLLIIRRNDTIGKDKLTYLEGEQKIEVTYNKIDKIQNLNKNELHELKVSQNEIIYSSLPEVKKKIEKQTKVTLADIKAKYGKIAHVNLKSGKTYTGYFTQIGDVMKIVTTNGTVTVSVKDVKNVIPVN